MTYEHAAPWLPLLRPEARLLLLCARVESTSSARAELDALLQAELDWHWIWRQVGRHGIEPLVQRHLDRGTPSPTIPPAFLEALGRQARETAVRNMQQLRELLRLTGTLEADGVPVIPFKGPTLAALHYGNVAYRRFGDLDILVPREHIRAVKTRLLAEGYTAHKDLEDEAEEAYLDTQLGYEFVHDARKVVVEVHWAFFYDIYAFDLTPDEVWERHAEVPLAGTTVRALAPEDFLIYLCAHGTKHRWQSLVWIADVAELVRTTPSLDWAAVEQRAHSLGCLRMVHLGISLAHTLLDAPMPARWVTRAVRHAAVRTLAAQVCTDWLFQEPDAAPPDPWTIFRFHLRERERWRDRWPYIRHHLALWLTPVSSAPAPDEAPESAPAEHTPAASP